LPTRAASRRSAPIVPSGSSASAAAAREAAGLSYSQFMHGLKLAGITLDRKVLAETATADGAQFALIAAQAKAALAHTSPIIIRNLFPGIQNGIDRSGTEVDYTRSPRGPHPEGCGAGSQAPPGKGSGLKELAETQSAWEETQTSNQKLTEELEFSARRAQNRFATGWSAFSATSIPSGPNR